MAVIVGWALTMGLIGQAERNEGLLRRGDVADHCVDAVMASPASRSYSDSSIGLALVRSNMRSRLAPRGAPSLGAGARLRLSLCPPT